MADVEYERRGGVALVRINRPKQLNALNRSVLEGLAEAFTEIDGDPGITAAILTGTGRAFTVGMDLKEHAESGREDFDFPDLSPLRNPLFPVRDPAFNTPVIAAVNGLAYGGGWFMFTQCDLAVAAESAVFEISEIRQGLVAGWSEGLALTLPRPIAMELALGGRISARRAYEVGLVNDVVPDEQLLDRAWERAAAVAALPPLATQHNRDLVARLTPQVPETVQALAERHADEARASEDFREALAAFAERRTPIFQGR